MSATNIIFHTFKYIVLLLSKKLLKLNYIKNTPF